MRTPNHRGLLPALLILSHCSTPAICWQGSLQSVLSRPRRNGFSLSLLKRRILFRVHSSDSNESSPEPKILFHLGRETNLQPLKVMPEELMQLQEENIQLRESLQRVQAENERLHMEFDNRIIMETFEGEAKLRKYAEMTHSNSSLTIAEGMLGEEEAELCSLDENACPLEPTVSFGEAFRDRALWLVGLLALQSCSGFILARNEALLTNHPVSKLVDRVDRCIDADALSTDSNISHNCLFVFNLQSFIF
jgi:hypothetical protein